MVTTLPTEPLNEATGLTIDYQHERSLGGSKAENFMRLSATKENRESGASDWRK